MAEQKRYRFASLRILTMCHVLERARVPKSAAELAKAVNETMVWEWSPASVHRDLKILVNHKLVRSERQGNHVVYRWAGLQSLSPVED